MFSSISQHQSSFCQTPLWKTIDALSVCKLQGPVHKDLFPMKYTDEIHVVHYYEIILQTVYLMPNHACFNSLMIATEK